LDGDMQHLKFNPHHCHKWAALLTERRRKLNQAIKHISSGNFENAKELIHEIFYGDRSRKTSDPGMLGSLVYHMAMITKMASESEMIQEAIKVKIENIERLIEEFYQEFCHDVINLLKEVMPEFPEAFTAPSSKKPLTKEEK
jgi:hypothetical protein